MFLRPTGSCGCRNPALAAVSVVSPSSAGRQVIIKPTFEIWMVLELTATVVGLFGVLTLNSVIRTATGGARPPLWRNKETA